MGGFYEDILLNGRIDILDILFAGWIVFAGFVVLLTRLINTVQASTGGPNCTATKRASLLLEQNQLLLLQTSDGSDCSWLNKSLEWISENLNVAPWLYKQWIAGLNQEALTNKDIALVEFTDLQSGSQVPILRSISVQPSAASGSLDIRVGIETRNLGFIVRVAPADNSRHVTCNVNVTFLRGKVLAECQSSNAVLSDSAQRCSARAYLDSEAELELCVTQQDRDAQMPKGLDLDIVHELVSRCIRGAQVRFELDNNKSPLETNLDDVNEMVMRRSAQESFSSPPKPPRNQERKLLVKVVKAMCAENNHEQVQCDPYCVVTVDHPPQRHQTSVVKNSHNPFWDEQFLFEVNNDTRNISFDLCDREKPVEEIVTGSSSVPFSELQRSASSRQILPVLASDGSSTGLGSLTVEFVFLESGEAEQFLRSSLGQMREVSVDDLSSSIMNGSEGPASSTLPRDSRSRQKASDFSYGRPFNTANSARVNRNEAAACQNLGGSESESASTSNVATPSIHVTSASTLKKPSLGSRMKQRFKNLRKGRSKSAEPGGMGQSPEISSSDNRLLTPNLDARPRTESEVSQTSADDETLIRRSSGVRGSLKRLFRRRKKSSSQSREPSTSRLNSNSYN